MGGKSGRQMARGKGVRRAVSNSTLPATPGSINSNVANKASNGITVDACMSQMTQCNTVQRSAPFQTFNLVNVGPDPSMPEYDLLCAPVDT